MGKPFHELTDDEFRAIRDAGATWEDVEKDHPQPEWCDYPGALHGGAGCWSLVGRRVKSIESCRNCDLFICP